MGTIYFDRTSSSDWVKYKDGYWIGHRKRVYLYWFKYLQHAELSSEYNVDWTKYDGWGGSNSVLGMKFDNWWDDNWIDLFGTKDRNATPRFPISTKSIKTEGLRLSLLCWERRHAPVWNKRGNALSIAKQVYEYELGISGEKKPRYSQDEWTAYNLKPDGSGQQLDEDGEKVGSDSSKNQMLQTYVSRYLRRARKYLKNVCVGRFP